MFHGSRGISAIDRLYVRSRYLYRTCPVNCGSSSHRLSPRFRFYCPDSVQQVRSKLHSPDEYKVSCIPGYRDLNAGILLARIVAYWTLLGYASSFSLANIIRESTHHNLNIPPDDRYGISRKTLRISSAQQ